MSADGYFAPEGLTRRLAKERALLLGGPRALILQLSHPLVAAGVAEHSSFPADPVKRLKATLDSTLAIVFGTKAQADEAASRINRVHSFVKGTLPETAGRYEAGTPYEATDPELLLWVHATLVDTTFKVYPRFVAELTPHERDVAYEESKIAAGMLGVPESILPPDLASFRTYIDEMIASDKIAAASFQKALVHEVLHPKLRFVPRGVFRPGVPLTISLLPPRVRELYGLERIAPASGSRTGRRGRCVACCPSFRGCCANVPQSRGRVVVSEHLVPIDGLTRFLDERFGPSMVLPKVKRLGEGHSNLTFLVRRGDDEWVLRRPPRGDILPGTHEMHREFDVMKALLATPRSRPRAVRALPRRLVHRCAVLPDVLRRRCRRPWSAAPVPRRTGEQAADRRGARRPARRHPRRRLAAPSDSNPWRGSPSSSSTRNLNRMQQLYDAVRHRDVPEIDEVGEWLRSQRA